MALLAARLRKPPMHRLHTHRNTAFQRMLCLSPKNAGFLVHGLTPSNHPRRHTTDLLSRRYFPRPVLLDLISRPTAIRTRWFMPSPPNPYQSLTSSSVTSKNKSWSWLSRSKTYFTREVQVCRQYPVYFPLPKFLSRNYEICLLRWWQAGRGY